MARINLLWVVLLIACSEEAAPPRPNVILITFDTTRADRIGCYGHDRAKTPTLDTLARNGVRFDQAYTTTPVTLPSHASILTGHYPPVHGVRDNGKFRLPEEAETLAEALGANGYQTAAFVSAVVLSHVFGTDQGFDHYDDRIPTTLSGGFHYDERAADATTDAAIAWVDAHRNADAPLFLWVHYFDPHAPHTLRPEFEEEFKRNRYDGEIAFTDRELGRLLDHLRSKGLLDESLVIATADHGESLGEHGEQTHGVFIYDSTMRVPLIVAGGPFRGGKSVETPVSVIDIAPTVLGALELELPTGGIDLAALASASAERAEAIYLESEYGQHTLGWSPLYGVRNAQYKFIEAPRPELYDLDQDPDELKNKIVQETVLASNLRALLDHLKTKTPPLSSQVIALDEATASRLRQLGYTGISPGGTSVGGDDPKDRIELLAKRDQAAHHLTNQEFDEAEAMLLNILKKVPKDEITLNFLGVIEMHRQEYSKARAYFDQAFDLGPPSSTLLMNLAICSHWLGEERKSKEYLEISHGIDPTHCATIDLLVTHHRTAAIAAVKKENYQKSLDNLDAALGYLDKLLVLWYGDEATRTRFENQKRNLSLKRDQIQAQISG